MSDDTLGAVMVVFGALAVRLAITGDHLVYVRPGMGPLLLAAGVLVVVLGGAPLLAPLRRRPGSPATDAGPESHPEGRCLSRAGWLLALPIMAITLAPPVPLGAFAASRASPAALAPPPERFAALPAPRNGAVDMALSDFRLRAVYDAAGSLRATPVRMVGLVADDPDSERGFLLIRFVVSCCAADGRPVRVEVRSPERPPVDGWVEVEGTWVPGTGNVEDTSPPALAASSVRAVAVPSDPYE